jgi:hypothetical protein
MKSIAKIGFIICAFTTVLGCAEKVAPVFSPEQGVICDSTAQFCSDRFGISLGITKEYLGQAAADKWGGIMEDESFDASSYSMSNGLTCDTKLKICKKNKWDEEPDAKWTKVLFGDS